MAATTKSIPLGFQASDFTLPDTLSNTPKSLMDLKGEKATVLMFICNHCPYVKHVMDGLIQLAQDYQAQGVGFIAISSNDIVGYPEDSPEHMQAWGTALNFPFPYLFDETQEVARAYQAECTPDFSIFDENLQCVYRGRLDASRPGSDIPVTGNEMRLALDALLAGQAPLAEQLPSIGCSIKWK